MSPRQDSCPRDRIHVPKGQDNTARASNAPPRALHAPKGQDNTARGKQRAAPGLFMSRRDKTTQPGQATRRPGLSMPRRDKTTQPGASNAPPRGSSCPEGTKQPSPGQATRRPGFGQRPSAALKVRDKAGRITRPVIPSPSPPFRVPNPSALDPGLGKTLLRTASFPPSGACCRTHHPRGTSTCPTSEPDARTAVSASVSGTTRDLLPSNKVTVDSSSPSGCA